MSTQTVLPNQFICNQFAQRMKEWIRKVHNTVHRPHDQRTTTNHQGKGGKIYTSSKQQAHYAGNHRLEPSRDTPASGDCPHQARYSPRKARYRPREARYRPRKARYRPRKARYRPRKARYRPHEARYSPREARYRPHEAQYSPHEARYRPL